MDAEERVVAVVQARMGSTRLPGKVLLPLGGRPVIEHVVARLGRARRLDGVVVATTTEPRDEALAAAVRALGVDLVRGSPDDVLDRYAQAARFARASVVVRITADCPLIDWEVVDRLLERYADALRARTLDYASNTLERTYPRGLDVEAFSWPALERAARDAREPDEREHVTRHFYLRPERFRLAGLRRDGTDLSHLRWTLDTADDYAFLRAVFAGCGAGGDPTTAEVVAFLAQHPDVVALNAHVEQKS